MINDEEKQFISALKSFIHARIMQLSIDADLVDEAMEDILKD